VGRFNGHNLMLTLYLAVSLFIALDLREYARAYTAARLHDPTPRLWGRLTFSPKAWFEPFGSGLLPGLILVLWSVLTFFPPVVAYGKPAPIDPNYFRRYKRDSVVVGLAGPGVNLAFAVLAGLIVRATGASELARIASAFMFVNLCMAVFHLLPIPGLDGARLVALVLPPRAAETYRNLDAYLPLFVLVVIFLLAGPVQSITFGLTNAVCEGVSGNSCVVGMQIVIT
jgi:Zn-dependent protease